MSFTITNNSTNAVITKLETLTEASGSLTITSGSLPVNSGQTISGTNTEINNLKGSPDGSILLFLVKGSAQINYYLNSTLISAESYSSGLVELKGPIVQPGDTISIELVDTELPTPSPTPSATPAASPTATPTGTPAATPTPTPSATPVINPATLGALFWSRYSNESFLNITGGTNIVSVIDGVDSSTLFQSTQYVLSVVDYSGGSFNNVCTPSLSGAAHANVASSVVSTLNGDYGNSTTDYTLYTRFYWDGTMSEEFLFTSDVGQTLYDGTSLSNRWFQHKISNTGMLEFNVWADPTTSSGYISLDQGLITATANTWTNVAVRVYQDGANYKGDVYINGTLVNSNQLNYTAVIQTPRQGVLEVNGAENSYFAESGWFDFKLSDSQITDLFTYLNTTYC